VGRSRNSERCWRDLDADAGWWLASWASRALRRAIDTRVDPSLRTIITSTVRYGILVLTVVAVLGQLGVQTTSVLAALGAIGLAIGLALQGTLSNIAAGMMLLWLRPFRVGDYVDNGSVAGTVNDIGLFASELTSWDGIYLFVPNSQLWNTRIINYSRLPTRLVDLRFGVGYGDDLAKGREVLMEMAKSEPRVHGVPAPLVFVHELGDSAVVLALRVWTANADYWDVLREFNEKGKARLEAAGLSIPFPQRDVHLHPAADAPEPTVRAA
jgi:small conductance mechanosensitive channel